MYSGGYMRDPPDFGPGTHLIPRVPPKFRWDPWDPPAPNAGKIGKKWHSPCLDDLHFPQGPKEFSIIFTTRTVPHVETVDTWLRQQELKQQCQSRFKQRICLLTQRNTGRLVADPLKFFSTRYTRRLPKPTKDGMNFIAVRKGRCFESITIWHT